MIRMGQDKIQNVSLTESALHVLISLFEDDFHKGEDTEREEIDYFPCLVLEYYAGGPRGEKLPMIYLIGIMEFWDKVESHNTPFIILTLLVLFKV